MASGVVQNAASALDEWGAGRFDVVSWDPRGTNASTPVTCFTSDAARDQFWQGSTIPITRAESKAYQRKTVELARRCGEVSGELLTTSRPPTPPAIWTHCAVSSGTTS